MFDASLLQVEIVSIEEGSVIVGTTTTLPSASTPTLIDMANSNFQSTLNPATFGKSTVTAVQPAATTMPGLGASTHSGTGGLYMQ